jgi:hypothetical protein
MNIRKIVRGLFLALVEQVQRVSARRTDPIQTKMLAFLSASAARPRHSACNRSHPRTIASVGFSQLKGVPAVPPSSARTSQPLAGKWRRRLVEPRRADCRMHGRSGLAVCGQPLMASPRRERYTLAGHIGTGLLIPSKLMELAFEANWPIFRAFRWSALFLYLPRIQ